MQTDMTSNKESMTNCLRWSKDNAGLVVAGDDRSIRLFKVASATDFKTPFQMTLELQNAHTESINCVDISRNKTLLISAGDDQQACIHDLRKKMCIKKLTFRDRLKVDARGNPD